MANWMMFESEQVAAQSGISRRILRVAILAAGLCTAQAFAQDIPDTEYVLQDGKKFVEIDGELFPAIAALPPPPIPRDNPQTVDEDNWPIFQDAKVQLGYKLFFEPALSGDGSVSCATCHSPDEGWGLYSTISRGYPGVSHWVNSQTIVNTAYYGKLFWDGHALSLEAQAPSAAQGLSGNGKADMMEQRLFQVPEYRKWFKEIFGSDRNMVKDSWRAIAAFERALNTPDTPFDLYMKGDEEALDESQIRGMKLFEGKARCIMCHNGPLLTDEKYYNTGPPLQEYFIEDPIAQIGFRSQTYIRGVPEEFFRKTKFHPGVYLSTHRKEDIGKFRTAPLRYTLWTPPYMHNGTFDDFYEVLEFYNEGGGEDQALKDFGIATKTEKLKPLNLTDEEIEDLAWFLEALSPLNEIWLPTPKLPGTAVMAEGESERSFSNR